MQIVGGSSRAGGNEYFEGNPACSPVILLAYACGPFLSLERTTAPSSPLACSQVVGWQVSVLQP